MTTPGLVTTRWQVVEVSPGPEPSVSLHKLAARSDGMQRPISLRAAIPDPALFARLQSEVQPGDDIEITTQPQTAGASTAMRIVTFRKLESAAGRVAA
jgi:hypothetical protein